MKYIIAIMISAVLFGCGGNADGDYEGEWTGRFGKNKNPTTFTIEKNGGNYLLMADGDRRLAIYENNMLTMANGAITLVLDKKRDVLIYTKNDAMGIRQSEFTRTN